MAIIKIGDSYGVRIWYRGRDIRKVVGPDRKVAELVEAALRKEIAEAKAAGLPWTGLDKVRKSKRPRTFAEAAGDYLDERRNYKRSTRLNYKSMLDVYLLPEFGKASLGSITESHISEFFEAVLGEYPKIRGSRQKTWQSPLSRTRRLRVRRELVSLSGLGDW